MKLEESDSTCQPDAGHHLMIKLEKIVTGCLFIFL